jgi:DNA adenine methylase
MIDGSCGPDVSRDLRPMKAQDVPHRHSGLVARDRVPEADAAVSRRLLRPPLKWAGGKRWQLPHLRPLWTHHADRRLVEPFCGGLAVTLGLAPQRALLNDINPHVINFYRWLKRGLVATIPMRNDERLFYAHRKRFNQLLAAGQGDSAEAAVLFYYLNRTGYNGLCRFNRSGQFNVPFGRYTHITYIHDFTAYRPVFAQWEFVAGDFASVPLEPGDFVYADPPYDVEFTQYAQEGFAWEEQVRAARWLAQHSGPVVLANQATTRIVRLYRELGFTLTFLTAPRMISCTGDRRPVREVLALKNV